MCGHVCVVVIYWSSFVPSVGSTPGSIALPGWRAWLCVTVNSPSHLHGRRQPSNRSDGSLGSKRGGGLYLRRRWSSPSPKGRHGAITHPFSLTYMCEKCFPTYVASPNSTSMHWGNVYIRHFTLYHCVEFSLGIYGDLKFDSFFFQLRRNSFLVSRGPNSLVVRSHWFLESILIPRVWEFKIRSLLNFCMDGVRFHVGQIWSQNPLSTSSERKQRVISSNSPP